MALIRLMIPAIAPGMSNGPVSAHRRLPSRLFRFRLRRNVENDLVEIDDEAQQVEVQWAEVEQRDTAARLRQVIDRAGRGYLTFPESRRRRDFLVDVDRRTRGIDVGHRSLENPGNEQLTRGFPEAELGDVRLSPP
jgi:hypothetical protein